MDGTQRAKYILWHFQCKERIFSEQYRNAEEELPFGMPEPRGLPLSTTDVFYSSHAEKCASWESHTGFIILLNRVPVFWYSNNQQIVESSTLTSEFIALKICIKTMQGLLYKWRMFGIPIRDEGRAHVFCDNELLVNNSSRVEFTLKNKHDAVAIYYCWWEVDDGVVTVAWILMNDNHANALTKRLRKLVMG